MIKDVVKYSLGEGIIAFTTDRTIGREEPLVIKAVKAMAEEQIKDSASNNSSILNPHSSLKVVRPHQTHTADSVLIADEFFALPASVQEMILEGKDAVMSQVKGVAFGVSTADCIPVIVYDPEHHAAAAIHAGWRGTVGRIVMKTIDAMHSAYGTDPKQVTAAIGPGISLESFEVGQEVYDEFARNLLASDTVARKYPAFKGEPGEEKWHIDLKEVNRQQLLACGVKAEHISVSEIDTYTDERYFSARREQKGEQKCGRIFTAFVLE